MGIIESIYFNRSRLEIFKKIKLKKFYFYLTNLSFSYVIFSTSLHTSVIIDFMVMVLKTSMTLCLPKLFFYNL